MTVAGLITPEVAYQGGSRHSIFGAEHPDGFTFVQTADGRVYTYSSQAEAFGYKSLLEWAP